MDPLLFFQAVKSGLLIGSVYGLMSVGFTLIIGVMGIANFAQSEWVTLGMILSYVLYTTVGIDPLLSLPLLFVGGFVLGVLVERFVIFKAIDAPFVTQLGVTLALLYIMRYTYLLTWGPFPKEISTWYSVHSINVSSIQLSVPMMIAGILASVLCILLYPLLKHTRLGLAIRASAQNRDLAFIHGINMPLVYMIAFGIGVGLTCIAGGLLSLSYYISYDAGATYALIIFLVIAIGGCRSLLGSVVGGLIIGLIQAVSATVFSPSMKYAFIALLFLLITALRPQGLFVRRGQL